MALKGILDTRFFFAYFSPKSKSQRAWCKSVVDVAGKPDSFLAASTITIAELYENMGRLVGKETVRIRVASAKAKGIVFLPVDESTSTLAGTILLTTPDLPIADSLIGSTAVLAADSTVFTDDPHFTRIKGIKTRWVE